jgi:apolipoprotein N-acyltransferase
VNGLPRRGRVAAPSVAAGVLLALSLPPFGWWPLGPLGAGLLYWRLAGLALRTRVWSGWLAGLGCYVIGLAWARAFNWYGAAVLIVVEALFFAAAAALTPPVRGRAPAFVAACTLAEALRLTWPFGGLPLGGVFLGQAHGPLVELARLGGPLLITAGVWAGGVAIATLASSLWARRHRAGGPSLVGVAVVTGGIVALAVAGTLAPDGGAPVRTLRVAMVQGGGQRGLSKEQVSPTTVFEAQVAASSRVTSTHSRPELVLWPEDVVALDRPLAGSPEAALLSRLAEELGTTLVVGVTEPASATAFRNEIVAWDPSGHIVSVFEKVHRVPFGEYVPYRSFFSHLADLSGVPTDAVPGHGTGLMRTPAGPLGLLVSFEVFYAGRSHSSVRAGAELLAVPTNTSSYSTAQVPAQEISAAVVQAVETGRDLVQAAPTGYSTVVTDRGVVVERSILGRRQVLVATVALRRGMTPYDHWGDLPVLILSAVALGAGWARQLRQS